MYFSPDPTLANAACASLPDIQKQKFFSLGSGHKTAKAICNTECAVREACLAKALRFEEPGDRHGVWGGLSARERDRIYGSEELQSGQVSA